MMSRRRVQTHCDFESWNKAWSNSICKFLQTSTVIVVFAVFIHSFTFFFLIWMNMHNAHEFNYEMCRCSMVSFFFCFSALDLMLYWSFVVTFAIKIEFYTLGLYEMHSFDRWVQKKYLIGLNYGSGTIKWTQEKNYSNKIKE